MPGGKNYRQWYAIKRKLMEEGRWTSKDESSTDNTAQSKITDYYEPVPKRTRTEDTDDDIPPLEGEEGDPDKDNYAGMCLFSDVLGNFCWSRILLITLSRRKYAITR